MTGMKSLFWALVRMNLTGRMPITAFFGLLRQVTVMWILQTGTTTSRNAGKLFWTTAALPGSRTVVAIQRSLDRCGLGYIDLYLIHGPLGGSQARLDSWRAICDAQKEGKLKSVGVSCFGVRHLKELEDSNLPLPAVNQIDLHPFMTRVDVVAYCNEHDIALEAWAPLVRGFRFDHPSIAALADKHKKTPAQVLLRYSLQKARSFRAIYSGRTLTEWHGRCRGSSHSLNHPPKAGLSQILGFSISNYLQKKCPNWTVWTKVSDAPQSYSSINDTAQSLSLIGIRRSARKGRIKYRYTLYLSH
ncbi:hypothetical protein EYR40_007561 [Pleurotus pulmonarius]|nr:hypothetical protein EYR40_007561 [Pleurotus pulmonarius]